MAGTGGVRKGAGRKPKKISTLVKKLSKPTAALIMSEINEQSIWFELLKDEDPRIRLDSLKYLTDRRDGRAAQTVAMTGADGAPLSAPVLNVSFVKP